MKQLRLLTISLLAAGAVHAEEIVPDSTLTLQEVTVTNTAAPRKSRRLVNTDIISGAELARAACCNLGESFSTNPSVDVTYSDAATGARQIKLLGLAGTYVQMLTENTPDLRGPASQFGLGYIPGSWLQSIQVSKGTSSVKNGPESITGQINVELKKPQADTSLGLNAYYDSMNRLEANATGNINLTPRWSVGLLSHAEARLSSHDSNGDTFMDSPLVRQINLMPRVAYRSPSYIFQAAIQGIAEERESGQMGHDMPSTTHPLYRINIDTRRLHGFAKNAYIFDHENDGNVALILSGTRHLQNSAYGNRFIDQRHTDLYASLMLERKWNDIHSLSTGLSAQHDGYDFDTQTSLTPAVPASLRHNETLSGGYAQYTLNLDNRFIAMAGLRYDHSSLYGGAWTPRVHLRYNPTSNLSLHASAGRGMHSPVPLAQFGYLLASSRRLEIEPNLKRETATNLGAGLTYDLHPFDRKLSLAAEYYHTRFSHPLTLDLDSDPHASIISTPDAPTRSNAVQIEATLYPLSDLTVTGAWRYTDVKIDYGQGPVQKPLTSPHKFLLTAGYTPMMGIWQFDVTATLNGGGRMPTPYTLPNGSPSWSPTYKAYPNLNAQITRNFRNWSVYVGGENLTSYRQPHPIIDPSNPFGPNFDATMVYGPLDGAMFYAGFRFNITKY